MPLDPALLGTPTGHGSTLAVPDPVAWVTQIRHNMAALSAVAVRMGDQTLAAWRSATRIALTGRDDLPIVVLGHQPEFIHPGVWAKHLVADRFARALGGVAVNLVVDNDVLKSSTIALPHRDAHQWTLRPIRFTSASATTPYEFLPAMSPADITHLEHEFHQAIGHDFTASPLPAYIAGIRSTAQPHDWVSQMVAGRRAVDQTFGINLAEHRVSQVSFAPLLLETLREPLRFARAYNDALQEYRTANAVRDSRRPMPDLFIHNHRVELPWWCVRRGLSARLFFENRLPDRITLFAEQTPLPELTPTDLATTTTLSTALAGQTAWSIRPRAITLTLWARLLLADFFLHGIGGAKYDAVCDGIITRYFGLAPPYFAAVSATLHWDAAADPNVSAPNIDAAHALRDLRYNPQRHLAKSAKLAELFVQRQNAIDESIVLARNSPADRAARRRAFHQIHTTNAAILDTNPEMLRERESHIAAASLRARQSAIALGREYFFAAYPRTELARLAAALPAATDFGL